mmetsp:Transcript_20159/g.33164  ORF Transcript_20159/g.33164 Transcript_20159/m.33164 type:complete len:353 (+) Transcript_20159:35-1093(+)
MASSSLHPKTMLAGKAVDAKVALQKIPIPIIQKGEVLIKVCYFGINRADILQRKGLYPPPEGTTDVLGLECAGLIVATWKKGEGASSSKSKFLEGERVMALLSGGGYAEYVVAKEETVMRIPPRISLQDAAAIPEQWLTAFQLIKIGEAKMGDYVVVHAAGSGVGTSIVQQLRLMGAFPIAVAGKAEKLESSKSLGAVFGVNYKESKEFGKEILKFMVKRTRTESKDKGVDLVLDCVGASHFGENIRCLGVDGRWVLYGLLGGAKVNEFNLGLILGKRISLRGTTLRSRSTLYKAKLIEEFEKQILPHFGTKEGVAVKVNKVFEFNEIQDAHDYMESNKNFGKILVKVVKDA